MTRTKLITTEEISSVYIGRAGKCCCGCAGKYSFPSTVDREAAEKSRGYALDEKDISDRSVAFVMRKLNVAIVAGTGIDDGGCYVACEEGTRLYIVYLKDAAEDHIGQAEIAQGVQ
jgi:hypothetical protein